MYAEKKRSNPLLNISNREIDMNLRVVHRHHVPLSNSTNSILRDSCTTGLQPLKHFSLHSSDARQ